jgi:hypothetical protein
MAAASAALFSSPNFGIAALVLAIIAIAIAFWRRINFAPLSAWLICIGTLLLAVAAAGPQWNHPRPGTIAVMVDLSPSTRGAKFRDPDFAHRRILELIGATPYQIFSFAAANQPLDPRGPFKEIPADRTIFSPPPNADIILLFSDARFDPPARSPPIYPIIDDGLENVTDASVQNLQASGQSITATISNTGPPRQATFPGSSAPIGKGTFLVTRPIPPANVTAKVELNPADLWPENDSLTIQIAPRWLSEKWWIGENPPSNWRSLSPTALPDLPDQYLAPAIIVINNQSADVFSPAALDRLMQYVRDLGGSVLIAGGDHAFAAGHYPGSALEQISPLSSSPPQATMRWILLADASGSMSQDAGGVSRWQAASSAIVHLLPFLPPADLVQIGQFSDIVKWWLPLESCSLAAKQSLPPPDAFPHGPTNLESALNQIADQTDPNLPTQLLLVSDCDAEIDHPERLQENLLKKNIHLHVLAIDRGSALEIIRKISAATGGAVISQFNPRKWSNSIRQLSQAAQPPLLMHEPIGIHFDHEAKSFPNESATLWNRTWLKPDAHFWATASRANLLIPMAASWHVGSGTVAALAFRPDPSQIESLAAMIAQKPRDPRFSVQWNTGGQPGVTVDAAQSGRFLNDLQISLRLENDAGKQIIPLKQIAPGRYQAQFDSQRTPRIATLQTGSETIDRTSIPGRYPPEFDAVGNDHDAMEALADQTGGRVIWPTDHNRINFRWPIIATNLAPWICAVAFLLVSIGLVAWRRS